MDWVLFFTLMFFLCMGGMVLMMFGGGGRRMHSWHSHSPFGYGADEPPQTPSEILGSRYARGEINEERYRAMRAELDSHEGGR